MPCGPIGNRIITRGMGTSRGKPGRAGMITQGYGGFKEAVIRRLKRSSRAIREELREITVFARLMEINNEEQVNTKIKGTDTKHVSLNEVLKVITKRVAVNLVERIKVIAKRITKK